MILFLDGIPSSGGPRCLVCRGVRGFESAAGVVASAACSVAATSLVVSVKGSTWPGTLVGPSVAGVAPLVWR